MLRQNSLLGFIQIRLSGKWVENGLVTPKRVGNIFIRYSLLRASKILTIDKFCFNYLLWLNVSYFGEKLENVSFIFTKQPTRARFLLKNAQAHVFFQTESLAWTDAKLNFARSRPDEIRQILETFYNFFNRLWHQFAVKDRSIVHVLQKLNELLITLSRFQLTPVISIIGTQKINN